MRAWHEDEVVNFCLLASLELHVLEMLDNLVDIGVISLTRKLENFVDIGFAFVEATEIGILLPHVDFDFEILLQSLAILFDALTFGVVEVFLVEKLFI